MRHIFRISDGGEVWDYSEVSGEAAVQEHIKLNYIDAGEPAPSFVDCQCLSDERIIRIIDAGPNGETEVRTAREWAELEEGLIGTTCV